MMTEDELRDRLHAGSVGIRPGDGLVETLAKEHARRHRRARTSLIGGSVAATALVVALLASLFTDTGPTLEVAPATPPSDAEILKRAIDADKAAHNMIVHFRADEALYPVSGDGMATSPTAKPDLWTLRAENRARILWPGVADTTIRPGLYEYVHFGRRLAVYDDTYQPTGDLVTGLTRSALGGPDMWLLQGLRKTERHGDEIRLIGHGNGIEVWVDARTYLIKRAVVGGKTATVDYLPATAENRELLVHTVPDGFTRRLELVHNPGTAVPPRGNGNQPSAPESTRAVVPQTLPVQPSN